MTTSLSKAPSIEEKYCVEEVDKSIVAVKFLNSSRCVIQVSQTKPLNFFHILSNSSLNIERMSRDSKEG